MKKLELSSTTSKFRRLIRHRCQFCGRDFFTEKQAGGRPRLFCDKKCKDGEFRRRRYLTLKNVETRQKTEATSKVSRPDFADRPLNLLGGHRWPNTAPLDREVAATIIDTEIGIDRRHPPALTADQRREFPIPADLSIPAWLRRGRS